MVRFIIVYHSTTGNTKALATAIADGARSLHIDAELRPAFDTCAEDVLAADIIGFGVPTFHYHPANPILKLLEGLDGKDVKGKIAVVFGSYGWSGRGPAQVAEKLRGLGFQVLDPVIRVKYQPSENELFGCELLGKEVAMQLKNTRKAVSLNI